MNGKARCKILKEIRQKIADENDIPYVTAECTHQGECRGNCPRCEAELRYLEEQLEKRRGIGKKVAVAAVAAGVAMSTTACAPLEALIQHVFPTPEPDIQVMGEIEDLGLVEPEIIELDGDVSFCPEEE